MSSPHSPDRPETLLALLDELERDSAGALEPDATGSPSRAGAELWSHLEPAVLAEHERRREGMRTRFYRELADWTIRNGESRLDRWLRSWWPRRPATQAAFALAMLLIGLGLGALVERESGLERLRGEVRSVHEAVAIALLDHDSASERLRGVSLTADSLRRGGGLDQRALDGLLETVRHDPSENVRLAAVEALARYADRPAVRDALTASLPNQGSPLIQLTLAAALVESGRGDDEGLLRSLQQTLERDDLEPAVRERLQRLVSNPEESA